MYFLNIFIVCVSLVSVYSEEFRCNSTVVNYDQNCEASKISTKQHCYLDADLSKDGKLFISNEGEPEECMLKISGMKKEDVPHFETGIYSTEFQNGDWHELSWTVTIRKPQFDYIFFYLNKEKVSIEYPYSWKYIRVYVQGNLLVAKDDCVLQTSNKNSNKISTTTTPLTTKTFATSFSSENHFDSSTTTESSMPNEDNNDNNIYVNHTYEAFNHSSSSDCYHLIYIQVTLSIFILQTLYFNFI